MEQKRKRILFIVNPKSGTFGKTNWISMATRMLANEFDLTFQYTTHRGHACTLAQQAVADGVNIVAAVGGDGTVNEVASALVGSETALAILPLGSGNGLARDLGISTLLPFSSLENIKHLNIRAIDYGRANNVPFFCTCGIGFDALVSHEIVCNNKRGFWMYLKLVIDSYFRFHPVPCTFTHDGITEQRNVFLVNCANIRQFGFNAYIAPKADFTDGKLNVTIIKPFPLRTVVRLAVALFTKRIDRIMKYVETFECEKVTLQVPEGTPFHCDGDYIEMPSNNIEVEIVPQSLKVLIPHPKK